MQLSGATQLREYLPDGPSRERATAVNVCLEKNTPTVINKITSMETKEITSSLPWVKGNSKTMMQVVLIGKGAERCQNRRLVNPIAGLTAPESPFPAL